MQTVQTDRQTGQTWAESSNLPASSSITQQALLAGKDEEKGGASYKILQKIKWMILSFPCFIFCMRKGRMGGSRYRTAL